MEERFAQWFANCVIQFVGTLPTAPMQLTVGFEGRSSLKYPSDVSVSKKYEQC